MNSVIWSNTQVPHLISLTGLSKMKIKWIGIDCVAADHPMNTIQRIWHPKTFEEANAKLKKDFGKDWDELYPLDQYYQDMHLNLFPQKIVHAENLGGQLATLQSGRYLHRLFCSESHGSRIHVGSLRSIQRRIIR